MAKKIVRQETPMSFDDPEDTRDEVLYRVSTEQPLSDQDDEPIDADGPLNRDRGLLKGERRNRGN